MKRGLITSADFYHRVVPELQSRWDRHCFCRNEHFLKLVSFDFRGYGIAPVALMDAEHLINGLIKHLEPMGDWVSSQPGNPGTRRYRFSQCAELFDMSYEQYSINMDCTSLRSSRPLPTAAIGQYLAGYHYYTKEEQSLERISDFRLAESVEQFIDDISKPAPDNT